MLLPRRSAHGGSSPHDHNSCGFHSSEDLNGVALRDDRTNSGRILRTVDRNSEERGIASSVAMWAKVKYWAHAGKSDEYVKQRVGMAGLTGKALEFDPNYKYLERFWHRLEGRTLDKWVRNGLRHTEPGWA